MKRSGAGSLSERVTFQRRNEVEDGFGNETGEWTAQFTVSARLTPRLGGAEEIVAARMNGNQPFVLRVRSSSQTRSVTTAWRAFDARAGMDDGTREPSRIFNLLSLANLDERGQYIDFLVSEGQVR